MSVVARLLFCRYNKGQAKMFGGMFDKMAASDAKKAEATKAAEPEAPAADDAGETAKVEVDGATGGCCADC